MIVSSSPAHILWFVCLASVPSVCFLKRRDLRASTPRRMKARQSSYRRWEKIYSEIKCELSEEASENRVIVEDFAILSLIKGRKRKCKLKCEPRRSSKKKTFKVRTVNLIKT